MRSKPIRTILITGGSGRIGTILAHGLADRYALTLLDRRPPPAESRLPFIEADIGAAGSLQQLMRGYDTVIHLAADPRPRATWESLLPNNIDGTRNVLQAAAAAGCRRVVFASSLYAVLGYPREVYVTESMPVRPSGSYGLSKAWGERMARWFAHEYELAILCMRIGYLTASDSDSLVPWNRNLPLVITPRDLLDLVGCCIEAPDELRFGIVHGTSNNRHRRFALAEGRRMIGYRPQDDAYRLAWRNYRGMLRRLAAAGRKHIRF
jgi:nucleoside-diphosphate-sugar epimerase